MRSLFLKGFLAFLAVLFVALGTMALLAGWATTREFRRYALTHGPMWNATVAELREYYVTHGSWEGLQERLLAIGRMAPPAPGMGGMMRPGPLPFRLAEPDGRIVADTSGPPQGVAAAEELERGVSIEVDGQVVGILLPAPGSLAFLPLDTPQVRFLARVRLALVVAGLAGLVAALVIGGLLFRSIVAPLRGLTAASRAIARGDLAARAPVRGHDELSELARAFNSMAESLARAETARRNQTADLAHELRTPLTVLQGTLEAMLDGVYPTTPENLQTALAQVHTLSRLVEDLRLLALADAGQLTLRKVPLDLRPLLREVVEAHRPQAQAAGVSLALESPPALSLVLADADRLVQVVGNLLSNSLRHVPEGGHITVRVTEAERAVQVSVVDDGPGVSPEALPRLFERFWRDDPSRRRATGGSGLGLAIARHIVEGHGGRIWAEPTPGGGLTVSFTIPAALLAA
jgi:signal transduction histidine kinase